MVKRCLLISESKQFDLFKSPSIIWIVMRIFGNQAVDFVEVFDYNILVSIQD